jgi:predicted porin
MDTGALEGAGSKPAWHGETTVGLKSGIGALRLGRAVDAIQSQDWAFDAWGNFSRGITCLGVALEPSARQWAGQPPGQQDISGLTSSPTSRCT